MNRWSPPILLLALLISACSQGISTLEKRIRLIKSNAETIAKREGTAKGNDLTGTFELKIWYGQLNCRSTSKYDAIEALENQVQEVPCEQDDGHFECKWVDGTVYKGYVDEDGSFGLAGEFMFEIEEGETTPAPTTATGIFSPSGKGTGSIMVAARGQEMESNATCLLTYSFELQKKEAIDTNNTQGNSETLTLAYELGNQSGQRLYRDLQVREDQRSLMVGARGGNNERVVARLHTDGTAEVSAHLRGSRDNRTLVKGPMENCTYEAKEHTGWRIDCLSEASGL